MYHVTNMRKSQLCAAATAVSAVGLVITPAPAPADPMIPLAPACAKYEFYQGRIDMWQDNGVLVTVQGYGTNVGNTAQYNIPNKTAPSYGTPSGGIIGAGDVIGINVNWTQGPGAGSSSSYTGRIDANGVATGTTTGQGGPSKWTTRGNTFKCAASAEAPQEPPKQDEAPPPATPKTATVNRDTNIFDAPDGRGTEYRDANGDPIFKSPGPVTLVEPELCRNDWCHVVAPEVPPGTGWIYIGEGFGTYNP